MQEANELFWVCGHQVLCVIEVDEVEWGILMSYCSKQPYHSQIVVRGNIGNQRPGLREVLLGLNLEEGLAHIGVLLAKPSSAGTLHQFYYIRIVLRGFSFQEHGAKISILVQLVERKETRVCSRGRDPLLLNLTNRGRYPPIKRSLTLYTAIGVTQAF